MQRGAAAALLAPAAAAVLAIGCGSEREFEADEFMDAVNAKGAELVLGAQLTSSEAGEPVYEIRSASPSGGDPNPQLEEGRGGGTLVVAGDAATAGEAFDRCEVAAELTCFRVANVVLRFEEMPGAERARISGAVSAMASDG